MNTNFKVGTLRYSSRRLVYQLILSLFPQASEIRDYEKVCSNLLEVPLVMMRDSDCRRREGPSRRGAGVFDHGNGPPTHGCEPVIGHAE